MHLLFCDIIYVVIPGQCFIYDHTKIFRVVLLYEYVAMNFSTQVFTGPVIPYLSSFWISLCCGTLSNALAKSIMITSVCLPPLRLARISCVKATNCVSVDRFFRNPCYLSNGILLASRWFSRCLEIMCSISLLHTHVSDTGR